MFIIHSINRENMFMPLGPSGDFPIKKFQKVLAKLGIFLHNYETGESFANDIWKECGYTEKDMESINWLNLIHPEDREKAEKAMNSAIDNKTDKFDVTYRVRTVMGDYKWIYNSGMFLSRDDNGNPALFLGADWDITALKESEQKLSEALITAKKKTFELETLQAAGKAVTSLLKLEEAVEMILNQIKKVIPYSTASVQLLEDGELKVAGTKGWDLNELKLQEKIPVPSKTANSLVILQKQPLLLHDLKEYDQMECVHHEISSWIGIPLIIEDHVIGLLSCNSYAVNRFDDDHLRLAAGFGDYMAIAVNNAKNHEKFVQMAITDPLTGISNRRSFFDNGERLFCQAVRYNWPLSVLMLDLDDFKKVNDQYGHSVGDEILIAAAAVFKETIRKTDLLGRYGGEEFCIILPETDPEGTKLIAERILKSIRKIELPGGKQTITVSIGISFKKEDQDDTFEKAIARADEALYSAKDQNKDRWVIL